MPEVQTTSSDQSSAPPLMNDAQVGDAVATKFLSEVRQAMTGPTDDPQTFAMADMARQDFANLQNDPQEQAVLKAIAQKIESNDPSLGPLKGKVERPEKNNYVFGFVFDYPQQEAIYTESLNKIMGQGFTLNEAVAKEKEIIDNKNGSGGPNHTAHDQLNLENHERGVLELNMSSLYDPIKAFNRLL